MNSNENKKGNNKKYLIIAIVIILAIAGIIFGVIKYNQFSKEKEEKTLAYTDLIIKIRENSVEKVEMKTKSNNKNKYTENKILYINKENKLPTKLIIEDNNQNTTINIQYNKIEIN